MTIESGKNQRWMRIQKIFGENLGLGGGRKEGDLVTAYRPVLLRAEGKVLVPIYYPKLCIH